MGKREYDWIVEVPLRAPSSEAARGEVINALLSRRDAVRRLAETMTGHYTEIDRQLALDATADDLTESAQRCRARIAGAGSRSHGEPSDTRLILSILAGQAIRHPHRRSRLEGWRLQLIPDPTLPQGPAIWSLQRMSRTTNADGGWMVLWSHVHNCGEEALPELGAVARAELLEAWNRG